MQSLQNIFMQMMLPFWSYLYGHDNTPKKYQHLVEMFQLVDYNYRSINDHKTLNNVKNTYSTVFQVLTMILSVHLSSLFCQWFTWHLNILHASLAMVYISQNVRRMDKKKWFVATFPKHNCPIHSPYLLMTTFKSPPNRHIHIGTTCHAIYLCQL